MVGCVTALFLSVAAFLFDGIRTTSTISQHTRSKNNKQLYYHQMIYSLVKTRKTWIEYAKGSLQFCVLLCNDVSRISEWMQRMKLCFHTTFKNREVCVHEYPFVFESLSCNFPRLYEQTQATRRNTFPFGQECFSYLSPFPRYSQNSKQAGLHVSSLQYIFSVHHLFGLNLTFLQFLLKDSCNVYDTDECDAFKSVFESFKIRQNEGHPNRYSFFAFCMTRAQWSMFTSSSVRITHHGKLIFSSDRSFSTVKFNFQLICTNALKTLSDQFHSILLHNITVRKVFLFRSVALEKRLFVESYFILGNKYEQLKIEHLSSMTGSLFVHERISSSKFVPKTKLFQVNYFYCVFTFLRKETDTFENLTNSVSFQFTRIGKNKTSLATEQSLHLKPCARTFCCHEAHEIRTKKNMFAYFEVHTLPDAKTISYLCFYGGVAFFDGKNLAETFQQCDRHHNYTVFHKPANNEEHTAVAPVPYTASSFVTLLVFYLDQASWLDIYITVKISNCRGVFINTCSYDTYPPKYTHTKMALTHKTANLFSNYPEENESDVCIFFHLSDKYLQSMIPYKPKNCLLRFVIFNKNAKSRFCGTKLVYKRISNIRWSYLEHLYSSENIALASETKQMTGDCFVQQISCDVQTYFHFRTRRSKPGHNARSPLLRGRKSTGLLPTYDDIFKTSVVLKRNSNTSVPSCEMQLQFPATRTKLLDTFHQYKRAYWSYTYSFITIKPTFCANATRQFKTNQKVFLPKSGQLCLRQNLYGTVQHNMVATLALKGSFTPNNCVLGDLKFKTNLCLSSLWSTLVNPVAGRTKLAFLLASCVDEVDPFSYLKQHTQMPHNMGEDQMVWESLLDVFMFKLTDNFVQIDLPGLLLSATLTSHSVQCCEKQNCSLFCQWTITKMKYSLPKIPNILNVLEKGRLYFHTRKKYVVVSPNLNKYFDHPGNWTWHEANAECTEMNKSLPSFLSQEHVEDFVLFLKRLFWNSFPTVMFVGLPDKV